MKRLSGFSWLSCSSVRVQTRITFDSSPQCMRLNEDFFSVTNIFAARGGLFTIFTSFYPFLPHLLLHNAWNLSGLCTVKDKGARLTVSTMSNILLPWQFLLWRHIFQIKPWQCCGMTWSIMTSSKPTKSCHGRLGPCPPRQRNFRWEWPCHATALPWLPWTMPQRKDFRWEWPCHAA